MLTRTVVIYMCMSKLSRFKLKLGKYLSELINKLVPNLFYSFIKKIFCNNYLES